MIKTTKLLTITCLILLSTTFYFGFQKKDKTEFAGRPMDVGVIVSDLEKSLDFYTNIIGMEQVSTYHVSPDLATTAGLTEGKAIDIINLKLNDEPGAPGYKLAKIQGKQSENLSGSFIPGDRYLTLHVDDIDPYREKIKEQNIKLWNKEPVVLPSGIRVLILQDPDGAMLELMSPPEKQTLSQSENDNDITSTEKEKIKEKLILELENHINDVTNLDFEKVISFYAEDVEIFMDGKYVGEYDAISGIYKWAMDNWIEIYRNQVFCHKIKVFSKDAAMMTVLFDHGRIEPSGDTTEVTGASSYGMRKINNKWKIVMQQMDHNYDPEKNGQARNKNN